MSASTMGEQKLPTGSWLDMDYFLGESVVKGQDPSTGSSVATSYTTESSDCFVIDDNYEIGATKTDTFDDMSTILDSVATQVTHQQKQLSSSAPHKSSRRRLGADKDEEEDSAQYDAYLKAKMFSLWGRIQDEAGIEEHSEMPRTENDAKLLDDFARKM